MLALAEEFTPRITKADTPQCNGRHLDAGGRRQLAVPSKRRLWLWRRLEGYIYIATNSNGSVGDLSSREGEKKQTSSFIETSIIT
jgi:hypothetical protein